MAQEIKQGNIFGRIGSGIGQGLAEQVPKEIERSRLSSGLKQLSNKKNLSPFEQFSELSAIPGVTPQIIESGSKLLRETARGNALRNVGNEKNVPSPFPQSKSKEFGETTSKYPSLTEEETLAKYQEGYIPPTQDQIYEDAGQMYNENPALFGNDPQKALEAAELKASKEASRASAFETRHQNLSKIQDNVVTGLKNHSENLGVKIPANIYSKIEDEAIEATKPKNKGGRGLTEQAAKKEYGQKLDEISRNYSNLNAVGNWGITSKPASYTLDSLKSLQKKFESFGDTENLADFLIAEHGNSPSFAYSIAEPIYREPKLNKEIKSLPKLEGIETLFETVRPESKEKTLEVSKKILPFLGEKGSPLAVAYELEKKGYDPEIWMNYVRENQNKLKYANQLRQLDKTKNLFGTINDWWLSSWSGIDNSGEE